MTQAGWTVLASRHVHRDRWVSLRADDCLTADGTPVAPYYVFEYPDWVHVVALDEADNLLLVRQYRHGVEDFLWEIPAGKLDHGEPPQTAAVRELAEEAGVTAGHWESLGEFLPAPGLITERVHLYLAMRLTKGEAAPESDEELELQWLPLEEAMRRVVGGQLDDGKTALALIRAHGRLQT